MVRTYNISLYFGEFNFNRTFYGQPAYPSGSMTRHSGQYCQGVTTQVLRPSRTMEMKARCMVWSGLFGQARDFLFIICYNISGKIRLDMGSFTALLVI